MFYGKGSSLTTAEFWEKQAAAWRKEQEENRAAVARHESTNKSYFELGVAILELASNAYENYRVRSLSEKRRLASAILSNSNLTVTGENVVPIYKEPFGLLAEGLSRPNWLPGLDKLRNWLRDAEDVFRRIAELDSMESVRPLPSGGISKTNPSGEAGYRLAPARIR